MDNTNIKKEILYRNAKEFSGFEASYEITEGGILNAMEEYADKRTHSLKETIEEMRIYIIDLEAHIQSS